MGEALALSREIGVIRAGEVLAFPGTISAASSKQLAGATEELIRNISLVLENMVQATISKQTAVELSATRDEVFPKYAQAVLALSALLQIVLSKESRERLNREFFCELEADLRDRGLTAFGADVRDQGMFTVWTLRKVSDYLSQIATVAEHLPKEKLDAFVALGNECVYHAIRTRFHVNCLMSSMESNLRINSEALDLVMDGLRSVVNTYALTRQLLDLFVPLPETSLDSVEWDDEDDALLRESYLDPVGSFA
jgi:hypothetical protein